MRVQILLGFTAMAVAAATASALPATGALASASAPASGSARAAAAAGGAPAGPYLSARVSPSWQTNNTVWAVATGKGVVYAGGEFTRVRPPGARAGSQQVTRTGLAAFSVSTGALESFNHKITGANQASAKITALALSPSGGTLYVGGTFKYVDGQYRDNLAAFDTANGQLTSWAPAAYGSVLRITTSPSGAEVYLGGDFNELDGVPRTFAGAVNRRGVLQPWAPALNNAVTSLAVPADGSRVLIGGYFQVIDGITQNAIGSTNPNSGAYEPWAASILPYRPSCMAAVKDIVISGSTAYIASEGTGAGCFDGDFAATVSTGALVWQNDCLGATQALAVLGGLLYKGSHAHDCAFAPGGFPQVATSPLPGHFVGHHLLNQSLADGSVGHWTPDTHSVSSPTVGRLGPRALGTDGSQLFLGGDFVQVNGQPQQGFARFSAGPDSATPRSPAVPTVTSTTAGVDSVTFGAVSTADVGTLRYAIYRDGGRTPAGTVTATSWPWALPVLHFRDTGLRSRSAHTYTVTASDGTRTSALSAASGRVTVAAHSPSLSYRRQVLADHPSFFWSLGQTRGTTAYDWSPNGANGTYERGTSRGAAGPITGTPAKATVFDGRRGLVTSARQTGAPATFSAEGWFKTTTNTGGRLIGFGNRQTGASSSYDRQIYMMNDGQLVFGVAGSHRAAIETPGVYNDGQWHYVVATLSQDTGMALYVDGQHAGTDANTGASAYSGYWRVGYDNLGGWNLDYWGGNSQRTTEPNSYHFSGTIADVAVYPAALSAAQVAAHYAANALGH